MPDIRTWIAAQDAATPAAGDSSLLVRGGVARRFDPSVGGGTYFNVKDYGAVGDNVTDDGPAFNLAFAAARAVGGGTVFVPASADPYYIGTTVDATSIGMIRLLGTGGASRLRFHVTTGIHGIRFNSNRNVDVFGLRFLGTAGETHDAYYTLDFQSIHRARVSFCDFHGLQPTANAGAAVVHVDSARFEMHHVEFGACGGHPSTTFDVPTVRLRKQRGTIIHRVTFFDAAPASGFGTPRSAPSTWLRIHDAVADADAWTQGLIHIKDVSMDEGARWGLRIENDTNRYEHVRIDGARGNIAGAPDAGGVFVAGVRRLDLINSNYAYKPSLDPKRPGFRIENTNTARLRNLNAREGANRIEITDTVDYAEVVDCEYTTLDNQATIGVTWNSGTGPYVPTGGTIGQALVKASGTNYDTEWADAGSDPVALGMMKPASGSIYSVPGVVASAQNVKAMVADRMYYQPILVTTAITVDAILSAVTVAAGTVLRTGIYNADNDYQPTTLVVDAGAADPSTTGLKTQTFTGVELPPGRYLLVSVSDGTPTLRAIRGSLYTGQTAVMGGGILLSMPFKAAVGSGALASPGVAWDTLPGQTVPEAALAVLRVTAH